MSSKPRLTAEAIQELIDNWPTQGLDQPIVLMLALDLKDARAELAKLKTRPIRDGGLIHALTREK